MRVVKDWPCSVQWRVPPHLPPHLSPKPVPPYLPPFLTRFSLQTAGSRLGQTWLPFPAVCSCSRFCDCCLDTLHISSGTQVITVTLRCLRFSAAHCAPL